MLGQAGACRAKEEGRGRKALSFFVIENWIPAGKKRESGYVPLSPCYDLGGGYPQITRSL